MFKWLSNLHIHCWHITERRWKILFEPRCKILNRNCNLAYKYEKKCCLCPKLVICDGLDYDYQRLNSYPLWEG